MQKVEFIRRYLKVYDNPPTIRVAFFWCFHKGRSPGLCIKYSLRLPDSSVAQYSELAFTVAGPHRILTGFPFHFVHMK